MEKHVLLVPLFFLTALVYSMAGLGGGSTYLAILTLFSFPHELTPKVALFCNLVVAANGSYLFYKGGHLSLKKILPFAATSIPAAYLGGSLSIGKTLFSILLGIVLLMAALRMFLSDQAFVSKKEISWKHAWRVGLPLGIFLGALSGLVGIGGGIFLGPLLLFLGWADVKQAAASSSLFILVNSISGLLGQFSKGGLHWEGPSLLLLMGAVFVGGQIGSRLGVGRIPKLALQRITALLILVVSVRILWACV